jgi:uncharacterized protein YndB with AHSA1/START domain
MVIEESIVIHAPIDKVWETFTDVSCWKNWTSVLENVTNFGNERLSAEKRFTWCIRPFVFPVYFEPVVEEVVPHERIVWSAQKYGIAARHEFTFQQEGHGVRLLSREEFNGPPLVFSAVLLSRWKLTELTRLFLRDIQGAAEAGEGPKPQNDTDRS